MKPYYEGHGLTLYVADARDVLPGLVADVDLVLTDPPYGVSATPTGTRVRQLALSAIANDADRTVGQEVVSLAWTKLRIYRHAYVFGPFDLSGLPNAAGACELIWDKGICGMGDLSSPWGPQHEPIQFAMRASGGVSAKSHGGHLARTRRGSVLRHQRPTGLGAQHHVSEKPVALLRELIEMSSRHGETVLDPFAGSGSTLVAAFVEGRRAIGIELEEPWAEVAAKRIDAATRQPTLFAVGSDLQMPSPAEEKTK